MLSLSKGYTLPQDGHYSLCFSLLDGERELFASRWRSHTQLFYVAMAWREQLNGIGVDLQALTILRTFGWRCCARWALADMAAVSVRQTRPLATTELKRLRLVCLNHSW